MDIYQELKDAGCKISNHRSDLYVKVDPISKEIITKRGMKATIFISDIDHEPWYELPLLYTPFWNASPLQREDW